MVAIEESKSDPLETKELVVINPRQHADRFDFTRFTDLPTDDEWAARNNENSGGAFASPAGGSPDAAAGEGKSAGRPPGAAATPGSGGRAPGETSGAGGPGAGGPGAGGPGAGGPGAGGRPPGAGGGSFDPTAIFNQRDTNGDGKLSGDEISGRMAENMSSTDTNGDGEISLEEFQARMRQFSSGGGGGGRPGGGQ
jgi:hypothetical protein